MAPDGESAQATLLGLFKAYSQYFLARIQDFQQHHHILLSRFIMLIPKSFNRINATMLGARNVRERELLVLCRLS